jgi:hypothetical protein
VASSVIICGKVCHDLWQALSWSVVSSVIVCGKFYHDLWCVLSRSVVRLSWLVVSFVTVCVYSVTLSYFEIEFGPL